MDSMIAQMDLMRKIAMRLVAEGVTTYVTTNNAYLGSPVMASNHVQMDLMKKIVTIGVNTLVGSFVTTNNVLNSLCGVMVTNSVLMDLMKKIVTYYLHEPHDLHHLVPISKNFNLYHSSMSNY